MRSPIKKTLNHPKADPVARQDFIQRIKNHKDNAHPIIYLDESGFVTDMPRLYGWSEKGKRCYGKHDWQPKRRTNVIGALLDKKLLGVGLFDMNINSDIFYLWLTDELFPLLPDNCVIVMDNAPFHKRQDIQNAITTEGYILEYLPAYSPDLNDIEPKWAQAKALIRKQRSDVDTLFQQPLF